MRVVLESRHDVHVCVKYHLPRTRAVVHADIDAVGLQRLLKCVRNGARCLHDRRPVFVVDVEDIGRVFFGYDERVTGIYGIDIEESERALIFIHYLRGKFPCGDFTKKAISGTHVSSIPREIIPFTHYRRLELLYLAGYTIGRHAWPCSKTSCKTGDYRSCCGFG